MCQISAEESGRSSSIGTTPSKRAPVRPHLGSGRVAAQGKTIILTTHNLEEADALARRIVLINLGQIIADGTPEQIKGRVGGKRVSFRAPHATLEELNALVGTQAFQLRGDKYEMLTRDPEAVLSTLTRHGVEVSDLEVIGAGLEEAFLQLTGKSGSEEKTPQGMSSPRV